MLPGPDDGGGPDGARPDGAGPGGTGPDDVRPDNAGHGATDRIAELEAQLARRTVERDTARQALERQFLDTAAVPNAQGNALSARLYGIAREMQHISAELEMRNVALATANWRLEQRVAERTAALQSALDAKREGEARFRQVVNTVPQLIWTSHPEGRWDFASRRWQAYTGQTEEQARDLGWLDAVHPEDREQTMASWHKAVETGGALFLEHRLRGSDGQYRWFETQALPSRPKEAEARSPDAQWVGSSSDVHARKLAEQALREASAALEVQLARRQKDLSESEARFRAYFQITPEPLFVVIAAPDGRFLHEAFNLPFERLTGFREDQAQGRQARAFMPAETAAVFEEHYRLCLEGGVPHVFDALVALPAADRMLRITLVPTLGGDGDGGATRCLLGSLRDLSNAQGISPSPGLDA